MVLIKSVLHQRRLLYGKQKLTVEMSSSLRFCFTKIFVGKILGMVDTFSFTPLKVKGFLLFKITFVKKCV